MAEGEWRLQQRYSLIYEGIVMSVRPFLKWPGGKYRLILPILNTLPPGQVFAEPFVGAGAIFLNANYSEYLLNDINPDVIHLYQSIKKNHKKFIRHAQAYFVPLNNTKARYYALREVFNHSSNLFERSVLFLYLNRHGFNGLVRYNSQGIYNVPFGSYKAPYFPEKEIVAFSQKAQYAQFFCMDFADFMLSLPKKAVVYCDPPYVPLSKTSQFTSYAKQSFSMTEQEKLAVLAKKLTQQGSRVLISNHATPCTYKLYEGAAIQPLTVTRNISCKTNQRRPASELLALF